MQRSRKLFISAAEASSCLHAYHLIRALQVEAKNRELTLELFGIGDQRMRDLGMNTLVESSSLLAMGTTEVLARLPSILRAGRVVEREAKRLKPDLAVFLDYPDFHFKLAAKFKRFGVRSLSYIPPKVWVWRTGRIKKMKSLFDRILCIFPFEEKLYRDAGLQADYIGNPLADELPLELTREAARGLLFPGSAIPPSHDRVVTLLPGSRPGELSRHIPALSEAIGIAAAALRSRNGPDARLHVLVPFASAEQRASWSLRFDDSGKSGAVYHFSVGNSALCMLAADAGLIKSGTATLEAGVLGLPHIVFYRPSPLTTWIFRNFVQKKGFFRRRAGFTGPVGLVNLFSGWKPGDVLRVPEVLAEEVTGARLGAELGRLLWDAHERERQLKVLSSLRDEVLGKRTEADFDLGPSQRAANLILDELMRTAAQEPISESVQP
jgi:lipid-A-disaccharide synthase